MNSPAPVPLLLTPRQAAQMLAISERKLWSITFAEQPGLPYVKCGRLTRYAMADLQAWVNARRVQSRQGGEQ